MIRALLVLVLAGCAARTPPPEPSRPAPEPPDAAPLVEPAPEPEPVPVVQRRDLDKVLAAGPARFLARVRVRARFAGGRFAGWQLVKFTDPTDPIARAGVAPGDVLVAVNGRTIERPEQLSLIWDSLRGATAVTLRVVTGGAPRDVTFQVRD